MQPISARTRRTLLGLGLALPVNAALGQSARVWLDMTQKELDDAYDQSVYAPNQRQVTGRYETNSGRTRANVRLAESMAAAVGSAVHADAGLGRDGRQDGPLPRPEAFPQRHQARALGVEHPLERLLYQRGWDGELARGHGDPPKEMAELLGVVRMAAGQIENAVDGFLAKVRAA